MADRQIPRLTSQPIAIRPILPYQLSDDSASLNERNTGVRETAASSACLACRSKHLKCNGQSPCVRCVTTGSECVFIASRRGYKGPRRGTAQNPHKRQATSSPDDTSEGRDDLGLRTVFSQSGTPGYPLANGSDMSSPAYIQDVHTAISSPALQVYGWQDVPGNSGASVTATARPINPSQRCIDSFYHHFHGTHPFIIPKDFLHQVVPADRMEPLLAAMRWLGSLYLDFSSIRMTLLEDAEKHVGAAQRTVDGYLVQAMLLLIIGLDGCDQHERARELLNEAQTIAIQIGLNTRSFATLHGSAIPVLEESWRRTWWELYVVDAMIAGAHRSTNFPLFDIAADVALPCEEHQYLSGVIPQPLTLEDFEDQEFSGEEREFSSFAYRIRSARNLGKFMRTPPLFGPDDENISRIEALLTNFRLHLPPSKKNALQRDGRLDEMMFQALMMNNATSLILHQPFSQLDTSPTQDINSCAPHQLVESRDVFNTHTTHTIASATEISKMITHRVPLTSHTHFFGCIITLSSIVHLSKWALYFVPQDDDELRQLIRLNSGALNEMSKVWRAAERTRAQITGVAQEIYRLKKQQQQNSQYWLGFSQDQILNCIATDESIINDIESAHGIPPALVVPSIIGTSE